MCLFHSREQHFVAFPSKWRSARVHTALARDQNGRGHARPYLRLQCRRTLSLPLFSFFFSFYYFLLVQQCREPIIAPCGPHFRSRRAVSDLKFLLAATALSGTTQRVRGLDTCCCSFFFLFEPERMIAEGQKITLPRPEYFFSRTNGARTETLPVVYSF